MLYPRDLILIRMYFSMRCMYICACNIFLILVIYIICFAKPVCDLGRAELISIYLFTSLFLFYLPLILNIAKIVACSCELYRADINNITALSVLKMRTSLKQNALFFHSMKDTDVYNILYSMRTHARTRYIALINERAILSMTVSCTLLFYTIYNSKTEQNDKNINRKDYIRTI